MATTALCILLVLAMVDVYFIKVHNAASQRKRLANKPSTARLIAARQAADAAVIAVIISASIAALSTIVGLYPLSVLAAITGIALANALRHHIEDDDDWSDWRRKRAKQRIQHYRQRFAMAMKVSLPST